MLAHVCKGWGYEKWIVNKPEYCGKLLYFKRGHKCSYHFHKQKDETFYLQSGALIVKWTDDPAIAPNHFYMEPGMDFYVPPGRYHQMYAVEDSELFEFSTEHFEHDSYRIEKGD